MMDIILVMLIYIAHGMSNYIDQLKYDQSMDPQDI